MKQNDQPAPTRRRMTRKAAVIVAASVAALLVAGTGAFAAVQLTTRTVVAGPPSEPTLARPSTSSTPLSTSTPTPTPSQTAAPGDSASGTDSAGGSGGSAGGSSGGSSGGSGGGDVTPPPPPPPPPAPSYTDAEVRAAVVSAYGAVPVYGMCGATNYGTFGGSGGLGTPPPPVYVGILGYDAGALADGSGGWVKYYSCE